MNTEIASPRESDKLLAQLRARWADPTLPDQDRKALHQVATITEMAISAGHGGDASLVLGRLNQTAVMIGAGETAAYAVTALLLVARALAAYETVLPDGQSSGDAS